MLFLWSRLKLLVEPSAAVAFAPVLAGRYAGDRKRVGILLSGGNADVLSLSSKLNGGQ
jgi:threonine dehydratase